MSRDSKTVLVQTTKGMVRRNLSNKTYLWFLYKKPSSIHLLIDPTSGGPIELDSFIEEACQAVDCKFTAAV